MVVEAEADSWGKMGDGRTGMGSLLQKCIGTRRLFLLQGQHGAVAGQPLAHHCPGRAVVGELRRWGDSLRSEEHTSELQSHYSISYAVFCLKKNRH